MENDKIKNEEFSVSDDAILKAVSNLNELGELDTEIDFDDVFAKAGAGDDEDEEGTKTNAKVSEAASEGADDDDAEAAEDDEDEDEDAEKGKKVKKADSEDDEEEDDEDMEKGKEKEWIESGKSTPASFESTEKKDTKGTPIKKAMTSEEDDALDATDLVKAMVDNQNTNSKTIAEIAKNQSVIMKGMYERMVDMSAKLDALSNSPVQRALQASGFNERFEKGEKLEKGGTVNINSRAGKKAIIEAMDAIGSGEVTGRKDETMIKAMLKYESANVTPPREMLGRVEEYLNKSIISQTLS